MTNTTNQPVAAVRLRWRGGGPAMQFPLVILPGDSESRPVFLPALSVSQTYDVELLPADEFTAQPIAQLSADIHWPVDLLTKNVFLDPTEWRKHSLPPPMWSNTTKRSALCFGIVVMSAFGGVLLVRSWKWRLKIWAGLVVCFLWVGFAWILFFGGGVIHEVSLTDGYLVQTRRTDAYYLRGIGTQNAPVYGCQEQIEDETLIVHPEKGSYLTLHPNETRIFLKRRERECHE